METDNPHRADLTVSPEPVPLPTYNPATQLQLLKSASQASSLDFVSTEGSLLLIYIYF